APTGGPRARPGAVGAGPTRGISWSFIGTAAGSGYGGNGGRQYAAVKPDRRSNRFSAPQGAVVIWRVPRAAAYSSLACVTSQPPRCITRTVVATRRFSASDRCSLRTDPNGPDDELVFRGRFSRWELRCEHGDSRLRVSFSE